MATPITWTITMQQETSRPDATGRFVPGVIVGFTTSNGLTGTIFVPDAQYSPDNVKAMIEARVAQMNAIQGLKGNV